MAGAYQVWDVTSSFLVGSLTLCAVKLVSILNVSNVPALVVTVSWPTTFDLPDRFQALPLALLTLLDWNVQVLPTASGVRIPLPSLGENLQGRESTRFQDRS